MQENVGIFIEQIRTVNKIFGVNETDLKLLILRKLSGAAEEWFQSKPIHIQMSSYQLLEELEHVYGDRSRLVNLQEEFLNRKWRWRENEKFTNYYQEKIKLGSNFNFPENILVKKIIDGIDNNEWERQIKAFKIEKTSILLEKMEIAIRDFKIKNKITTKFEPCCYCKKDNHPSAKCHFKPDPTKEIKPEPCKYCKKVGHSPEKCYFKTDDSKKVQNTDPCKHCKKPGHLSDNCYFKSSGLPDSSDAKNPNNERAEMKKTKSESSVEPANEITNQVDATNLSEKKKKRWRCKSESKQKH